MTWVWGELKDGGIRICQECGKATLEDEMHWHEEITKLAKFKTKIYTHNEKESNWDRQEELGLSDKAMEKFKWCAMEVEFDAEVDTETGETWATAVNGVSLAKPVQLT